MGTLQPVLYGFTEDENIAKEFAMIRNNLHLIERKMSNKEYRSIRDEYRDYHIIPQKLKTRGENGQLKEVLIYMTEREAVYFLLHMEEIVSTQLGLLAKIDPTIFDSEFIELLNIFGYTDCYNALEYGDMDINRFGILERPHIDYSVSLYAGKYHLDELQIFLEYKKNTLFKRT